MVMTAERPAVRSDDQRYEAIRRKDPSADGEFIVGVTSTGIYCRPVCPSRTPKRENLRYFDDVEAAVAAGFRACLRCDPDAEAAPWVLLATRIREWLDGHLEEAVTLAAVGRAVGMSGGHAQRTFKRVYGVSPAEYVRGQRLVRFREVVRAGADVTTALYDVGYGSPSRLYERAGEALGMTPGRFARGGEGTAIVYAVAESWIGYIVVGTTERGICSVGIADGERAAERWIRSEYPRATVVRHDAGLAAEVEALLAVVEGTAPARPPLLDLRGTPFQLAVWSALANIPAGETRTYSDVAESIGKPASTRAVANACGDNPAPLLVPCHRVVRKDGGLGGYRWGVERKEGLLEREGAGREG